jgi:hypothetical protein
MIFIVLGGNTMTYSQKYILFADILGFSKYIESTVDEGKDNEFKIQWIINLLSYLRNELCLKNEDDSEIEILKKSMKKDKYYSNAIITQFSDSFIISREIDSKHSMRSLVLDACFIWIWGIYFRFIFRGAITGGKIIHNSDIVFGPDFITAYKMESNLSIYPRIVIDSKIIDNTLKTDKILNKIIKQDFDGILYVDTFRGLDYIFKTEESKKIILDILKGLIDEGLKSNDLAVNCKYGWLEKKYTLYKNGYCA